MKYQEAREEEAEKFGKKYRFRDRIFDYCVGWGRVDDTLKKMKNKK